MNFFDSVSWEKGPAHFHRQDNEQVYVIPARGGCKPIKVVFDAQSPDIHDVIVHGGCGNLPLLKWSYDDVFIKGGVVYCRHPTVPQIDTAAVEELL